jgi:hypothetical protein
MSEQVFDPITQNFIERGVANLREEFRGIFSMQTIRRFVDESIASLSGARVSDFVPCS